MRARLVVLVSGAGTNLQALLDACADPAYGADVVAVGADRTGIEALARAEQAGVPTFTHRVKDYPSRADWDEALTASCRAARPDLVILAGFMKLVGPPFLAAFGGRLINTHPALLPAFPGMHGVRDALEHGVKLTGCTVFLVDAGTDTGPVIAQAAVPVLDDDDETTLHERVKVAERALLVETVGRMVRHGWATAGRKVRIGRDSEGQDSVGRDSVGQDRAGRDSAGPDRAGRDSEGRTVTRVPIRRALISVYDKTGVDDLARSLHAAGVEIVSTGSTADTIGAGGVPVTRVEDITGFPEALDGRVKTLHPAVHAGLLADLGQPAHRARLDELGIAPFQLLVSNLYPFEAAVSSGAPPAECVEQIDIGGPAMVRAAAKNHQHVAVITDPSTYGDVGAAVAAGGFTLEQRRRLAARAYAHTAAYDGAVASWFASAYAPDETAQETGWPDVTAALWTRREVLRYGENPHQRAALYTRSTTNDGRAGADGAAAGIAGATQLHGKAMSYNNYVDAAAAWRAAFDFVQPCVAIIKHSNPCGIALGTDLAEAHRKANACDPESAFGGVIAANGVVTAAMAAQVKDVFTEIVIAPGFEEGALDILSGSKNLRLLTCPPPVRGGAPEWRQVDGGLLLQSPDQIDAPGDDPASWELKTGQPASPDVLADLAFAWRAIRSVKSNAILLASGLATVGVGMGQVNRVDAARLAVSRAGGRAAGSVAASDAYFPFPDGLEVLTAAGARAVVQPGGSVRDQLSIEAAEKAGIAMYVTGVRHFFH